MHTLLDLHGNIPTFIRVTDGKVHNVKILDEIMPEAGAFYVMDRGYVDFERLFVFTLSSASGITQKRPMRVTSKPANDKTRDIDTGERAYSLRRHEQCLERRKETTSHRTGEARMAVA